MRSLVARVLLSEGYGNARRRAVEFGRAVRRAPHVVSAFLELDDPNSYLLANYLEELAGHYAVDMRVCVTEAAAVRPEMHQDYAVAECRQVAAELGVPFLDKGPTPPVEHRRALLGLLAAGHGSGGFAADLRQAITAYWRGDAEAVARRCRSAPDPATARAMLERNREELERLGHYETATLHYGGEWYRGIERLHYLVARLDELGLRRQPGLAPRIASIRQVMQPLLPVSPPAAADTLPPLEMFHSLASPGSWIALRRIAAIADAFGVELRFRPVLPLAARGHSVPRPEQRYRSLDVRREALRHGMPLGRIADPPAAGVERLMAVWQYAIGASREREFLVRAGEAVWGQGLDADSDRGLLELTATVGFPPQEVVAALADEGWRGVAAANGESLRECGLWDVPAFRIGDWVAWGQDRDWLVARRLEELCDSGDGILV